MPKKSQFDLVIERLDAQIADLYHARSILLANLGPTTTSVSAEPPKEKPARKRKAKAVADGAV